MQLWRIWRVVQAFGPSYWSYIFQYRMTYTHIGPFYHKWSVLPFGQTPCRLTWLVKYFSVIIMNSTLATSTIYPAYNFNYSSFRWEQYNSYQTTRAYHAASSCPTYNTAFICALANRYSISTRHCEFYWLNCIDTVSATGLDAWQHVLYCVTHKTGRQASLYIVNF